MRVRRGTGTASTAAADGSSMTNAAAVAKPASANHSNTEPGPFGTNQPSTSNAASPRAVPPATGAHGTARSSVPVTG